MVLWGCPTPRGYLLVSSVPPEEHGIEGPVPRPPGGPLVGPAQPPVHLPHQGEGLLPQRVRDRAPHPHQQQAPAGPSHTPTHAHTHTNTHGRQAHTHATTNARHTQQHRHHPRTHRATNTHTGGEPQPGEVGTRTQATRPGKAKRAPHHHHPTRERRETHHRKPHSEKGGGTKRAHGRRRRGTQPQGFGPPPGDRIGPT